MQTYEEPEGMDQLFRPSPGEIIIGSQEAKRSTKTFISSERSAITLGLIESHARGGIQTVGRLHLEKYHEKLSAKQIMDMYAGCKRWVELHQGLVEHFASLEGFSVQAIVAMEKARWTSHERAESSAGVGDSD